MNNVFSEVEYFLWYCWWLKGYKIILLEARSDTPGDREAINKIR
jgi:hypothetical protein